MNAQANPGLVVWMRNPFVPSDRQVLEVFGSPTIAQWLEAGGIVLDQPTLILRNGHPVLMNERAVTPIHQGDVVALVAGLGLVVNFFAIFFYLNNSFWHMDIQAAIIKG